MILYFDSFITDVPLNKNFVDPNKWVRNACTTYAMPSKVDIAKYSLASYAQFPWSHVLIRYTVVDDSRKDEFVSFAKSLFPNATILLGTSTNQNEYRESLKILSDWDDNWIWYSPNNDHPLVAPDISHINDLIQKAQAHTDDYEFISIPYSHFSEYLNLPRKGSPSHLVIGLDSEIIEETDSHTLVLKKAGEYSSVQIVNKNLLWHWFASKDLGTNRIFRAEDVREHITTSNQLMLIPKKEICAHFDGYSHTINGINEILPSQVPPLFIPMGFFENNVKIAYGYDQYREGWTNINPAAKKYSFEDNQHGTDLKIRLEDIPLFWKSKIKEVDINKNVPAHTLRVCAKKNYDIIKNPWGFGNRKFDLSYLIFLLRNLRFRLQRLIN